MYKNNPEECKIINNSGNFVECLPDSLCSLSSTLFASQHCAVGGKDEILFS